MHLVKKPVVLLFDTMRDFPPLLHARKDDNPHAGAGMRLAEGAI